MRGRSKWVVAVAGLVAMSALPRAGEAQLGVAVRGGSLGLGVDAGLALGERLVVRGGVGVLPFDITGTLDDIEMTLELPRTWYNVGVDLYLTGPMRIGAGFLFKSDDVLLSATPTTAQDIGGQEFTPEQIGTLTGTLDNGDRAPYVLIGFGKHTASGFGLTLDLGLAFQEETLVTLDASGGTLSDDPQFRDRLDAEETRIENDLPTYIDLWPILSLGFRIGLGR
ncbi:MAG: hypothetical protein WEA34_00285 [Gemmatimonadota bacterium]